jgi:hypothetical protein
MLCSSQTAGFDIYFQQLATEVAILMPSSPCKIIGLHPAARYTLEQWWACAKRHVFRSWPYLIDTPTGAFLVTKCVKTNRYAQCLSKAPRGSVSQIHVYGMQNAPNSNDLKLPASGTNWQVARNDLEFSIQEAGGNAEHTVFIEREASRLFNLTDAKIKDAAQKLWMYVSFSL